MNQIFAMAGTENTFKYIVIANGTQARVGVRPIGSGFRVRVEPTGEVLESYSATKAMHERLGGDWKYPNGQPRFSVVVGLDDLGDVLADARSVIGDIVAVNPDCPDAYRVPFGLPPKEVPAAPAPTGTKECGLNDDLIKALLASMQALTAAIAKK